MVALLALGHTAHAKNSSNMLDELADLSMDSLAGFEVQTASKFMQRVNEAPSAVSVITSKEIKYSGWRTLADILASLSGVNISNDRNYMYASARGVMPPGSFNSRFLLLVDGHRLNEPIYGQLLIGDGFNLDVNLIDRIEYVPGPGSTVYGSNAFFGVINVITKSANDYEKLEVSAELGSAGSRKESFTKGWKTADGKQLLVSATHFYADGRDLYFPEFDTVDQNNGVAAGLDYERGRKVFVKGSAGSFDFIASHVKRTKGVPTASFEQLFNDPRSNTVDSQTFLNIGYQTALNPSTDIRANIDYSHYQYTGDYIYGVYDEIDEDLLIGTDQFHEKSKAKWWGGQVELITTHFDQHKLLAGLQFQKENPLEQTNWYVGDSSLELDSHQKHRVISVYLQDEISIGDDWLLNVGVRHENTSAIEQGSVTLPRIGLIYRAFPGTTIKALYGKAYRAPNAFELYFEDLSPGGQKVNPNLNPEYIKTHELVIDHQISLGSLVRLSAYQNDVSDLIAQDSITETVDGETLNLFQYKNIAQVRARGIEIQWQGDFSYKDGPMWRASYSWQRVKDVSAGIYLNDAPQHLGKINVSFPILKNKWRLGLEAQYESSRNGKSQRLGSHTLANLTLFTGKLVKNAELSASVYNLFDRKYANPAGDEFLQEALEQDGRSWRVKINYRF